MRLDTPDKHGNIRALPTTVGVQLIKDEIPKIFEYGISNGPLLNARQQKLKHHVVGEQDLWRIRTHRLPLLLFFLTGVLATGDGKNAPSSALVVFFVFSKFVGLRIDQGIHRIDHYRYNSFTSRIMEKVVEDCSDVGQ